jgi:hypothetical protein
MKSKQKLLQGDARKANNTIDAVRQAPSAFPLVTEGKKK